MTTLQPPLIFVRPTPRKLGAPQRLPNNARVDYWRQLNWAVENGQLDSRTRDFLQVTTFHYSDPAAADFYPSQAHMAALHGRSRRTIQRRIAAAKASKLLDVAQLKGFDGTAWFCSSNTHRPKFLPEWLELRKADRAKKRAQAREARIAGRAPRSSGRREPAAGEESSTYAGHEHVYDGPAPVVAPTPEELEELRKRHAANRAVLEGRKPPP